MTYVNSDVTLLGVLHISWNQTANSGKENPYVRPKSAWLRDDTKAAIAKGTRKWLQEYFNQYFGEFSGDRTHKASDSRIKYSVPWLWKITVNVLTLIDEIGAA
jgi:hypothetical protein